MLTLRRLVMCTQQGCDLDYCALAMVQPRNTVFFRPRQQLVEDLVDELIPERFQDPLLSRCPPQHILVEFVADVVEAFLFQFEKLPGKVFRHRLRAEIEPDQIDPDQDQLCSSSFGISYRS
jgi:hypothetical protein